jgi:hypothetical protein
VDSVSSQPAFTQRAPTKARFFVCFAAIPYTPKTGFIVRNFSAVGPIDQSGSGVILVRSLNQAGFLDLCYHQYMENAAGLLDLPEIHILATPAG